MIKIYDSQSGEKVDFKPIKDGHVSFYLCGPTVYDSAHLGHGRSAVSFDVIRRYFEYRDFEVNFVSNYTDIDDKMINRASEEGVSVKQLADRVIPDYENDYGLLGIKLPTSQPKATEHIDGMIDLIHTLEEKGHTYVLDDGVYFDVSTYKDYGKFSKQNLEELQMGSRIEVKDDKRNPQDFALWKMAKDEEPYDDYWDSPWGKGRPGWHIECSAMSRKQLGDTFDIHGGGLDLKFPHHECEVAQSRCALGDTAFARYWMHNGFIQIDNEKMSKSLGNFFTLKDIFKKYDPRVVRFMFLQTHYGNPINFSDALLEQAKAGLARIHDFVRALDAIKSIDGQADKHIIDAVSSAKSIFENCMDNDFDTSGALGGIYELVKSVNIWISEKRFDSADATYILEFLKAVDAVLGIIFSGEANVPQDIVKLALARQDARISKNFDESDRLRDEIKEKGYIVEDTPSGFLLKKA